MEHAELVAVCDRDKERAEAGKARFGVPAFTSVQDMIAGAKLDMVSVATAGHEYGRDHYEPTMEALEAGLHVLGEKPICNEIPLAEAMVAKARGKGLCYGINLNHRFTPAARLAKDSIRSVEVLEYPELGMEAIWKIEVEDFPAFIVVDDKGNDFYAETSRPVDLGTKK